MSKLNWLLLLSIFFIIQACKTTQPARPQEYYETMNVIPVPSIINIPIKIYKSDLEDAINNKLGEVLYEDKNLADDGMMLRATRKEKISIDIDNQVISYRLPLQLWIKRDLAFTSVEAEGSLALTFTTQYSIKSDWSLETKTELSSYMWIQEPVVKLGFANLPVTSIANILLYNTKARLARSIDEQVKEFFDLKSEMALVWKEMHQPFEMSEEYAAWLLLKPQSIAMTPMISKGTNVESTIVVVSQPEIFLGAKPAPSFARTLPPFAFSQDSTTDFTIFLSTEIPFKEAERISKQSMIGETFAFGKKTVVVEDIGIYGKGNRLVINTKLSGSYEGSVYFTAKPEYQANKNKIELGDVDFDFDTQKALMKSASWLLKGTMKKKIQENLNFYLNYNLDDTKNMIQEQLKKYEIAPGIVLKGRLDELNISHVYVATDAIKVRIGVKGNVHLDIKGLGL